MGRKEVWPRVLFAASFHPKISPVPRLINFDLSEVEENNKTSVLLASIDAAEQLLACSAVQELLIPADHFDDSPSDDIARELELVRSHLKQLTIKVIVDAFVAPREMSSLGISQAFEKGFIMRLNAHIFSRQLTGLPLQRCEPVMCPSMSLIASFRAVVVGACTVAHEVVHAKARIGDYNRITPEKFRSVTAGKPESGSHFLINNAPILKTIQNSSRRLCTN